MTNGIPRRRFLQTTALAAGALAGSATAQPPAATKDALDRILDAPVLELDRSSSR